MARSLMVDVKDFETSEVLYDRSQIYKLLPQRHEFEQLDGIVRLDGDSGESIAFREVGDDEWWCRGHIPGTPLFPGVLMLEAAAQLAAFTNCYYDPTFTEFVGFGGVDECKFRVMVRPPCRLWLLCRRVELRRRRVKSHVQGVVNGVLVYETNVTGLIVAL